MRRAWLLLVALSCAPGISCDKSVEGPPADTGQLQVYVHWEDQGLADRKLEIVEVGAAALTDADGRARFTLPPGTFTLRAYVTGPGPSLFTDVSVKVAGGRTTSIEVVDCLPCV